MQYAFVAAQLSVYHIEGRVEIIEMYSKSNGRVDCTNLSFKQCGKCMFFHT